MVFCSVVDTRTHPHPHPAGAAFTPQTIASHKTCLRSRWTLVALALLAALGCAESTPTASPAVADTAPNQELRSTHTRKLGVPISISHQLPNNIEPGMPVPLEILLQGTIPSQQVRVSFSVDGALHIDGEVSTGLPATAAVQGADQPALEFELRGAAAQSVQVPLILETAEGGYLFMEIVTEADGIQSRANHAIAVRKGLQVGSKRQARRRPAGHRGEGGEAARVELPAVEDIRPAQ